MNDIDINYSHNGVTYFENQTSVCFEINGEVYWFDMIERGDNSGGELDVDFITDDELPFEITEEMKDYMYSLVTQNIN